MTDRFGRHRDRGTDFQHGSRRAEANGVRSHFAASHHEEFTDPTVVGRGRKLGFPGKKRTFSDFLCDLGSIVTTATMTVFGNRLLGRFWRRVTAGVVSQRGVTAATVAVQRENRSMMQPASARRKQGERQQEKAVKPFAGFHVQTHHGVPSDDDVCPAVRLDPLLTGGRAGSIRFFVKFQRHRSGKGLGQNGPGHRSGISGGTTRCPSRVV